MKTAATVIIITGKGYLPVCMRSPSSSVFQASRYFFMTTSHLKKKILVQDQGGGEIETGGILQYSEDFNFTANEDIGAKDFFEKACILRCMLVVAVWCTMAGMWPSHSDAAAYPCSIPHGPGGAGKLMPVIGFMDSHTVREGQTLLDIARKYGLGYNQMVLVHPEMDPWLPETGAVIDIPSKWVLPSARHWEVVINIPEMRLYRFFKAHNMVKTYPIGIGREGFDTPVMETRVVEKVKAPSWTVPPGARAKYGRNFLPPGPENPLGDYWIGLSVGNIGIHGTNFPWGVGRRVSHGCIRLYPEHAKQFFNEVETGTIVEILYEPVKVGVRGDLVFLEVHPDIYGRVPDMESHAWGLIKSGKVADAVDPEKVIRCINAAKGVPIRISRDS